MDDRNFQRGTLLGCLGIVVISVALYVVISLGVGIGCARQFQRNLPLYPGAMLVEERGTSVYSAFTLTNPVILLDTPDPSDEVISWYARTEGEALRLARQGDESTLWRGEWRVFPMEGGSRVALTRQCY